MKKLYFVYLIVRAIRAGKNRLLDLIATTYYRFVCKRFGAGSTIGWGTYIQYPERVSIGSNVKIQRGVLVGTELDTAFLEIGDGCMINSRVQIDYTGGMVIEDSVTISQEVLIYTHSHGLDPGSRPVGTPKRLGSRCWLGARAIVLSGCEVVGAEAVIGAGAVASRSLLPRHIMISQQSRVLER